MKEMDANRTAHERALAWAMLFPQTQLARCRSGVVTAPVGYRAVRGGLPMPPGSTAAFLIQVENAMVKVVLKGGSALGHPSLKARVKKVTKKLCREQRSQSFPFWGFLCRQG